MPYFFPAKEIHHLMTILALPKVGRSLTYTIPRASTEWYVCVGAPWHSIFREEIFWIEFGCIEFPIVFIPMHSPNVHDHLGSFGYRHVI